MGYLKEVNINTTCLRPTRRAPRDLCDRERPHAGASAVKLIHGYGSSGKGGKIRLELRAYLERQKQRGKIRDYIPGERFSIFDEATRRAFAHCDELRRDRDLDPPVPAGRWRGHLYI